VKWRNIVVFGHSGQREAAAPQQGKIMALDAGMPDASAVAPITTRAVPNLRGERYFFGGMTILILATVLLGFGKTYFLAGMFRAPLPSWIIHVHGAAFTSWIVLLIVQTSLITVGRIDIHRRLGMIGFGLAFAMVVLGTMAATDLLRRSESAMNVDAKTFYAGTLGDMFIFAVLVFSAFRTRGDPATHKRLILIATITLMGAAINRWPFPILLQKPILIELIAYLFLLPLVLYDLWSRRRIHPATVWGGFFLIVVQQLEFPIGSTAVWQRFATWMVARVTAIHGG
jgi:hypothetical protein